MSEEATTSEVKSEGTQEVSEETVETAGTGEEGTKEVSEPEIPDDIKSEFDKLSPEKKELYNKEFKRFLTKYTQKKSEEFKEKDAEREKISKEYEDTRSKYGQLALKVKEALEKPEVYEQLRKEAGFVKEEVEEERPNIETADDMINYIYKLEEKIEGLKKGIPEEASKISRAEAERSRNNELYLEANLKLKNESPIFKEWEEEIVNHMKKSGIIKGFTGRNQYDLLKKATDDFFDKRLKGLSEKGKQEVLDSFKKKKQVSTITPQKSVSSKSSIPLDRREKIISKVRERFG